MGSKGRIPPTHMRRALPGPGLLHPDPFGPGIHHPPGAFSFDMLPPPEIMEQKLAAQHMEMQRIATENQRFAATHSSLRQELAAAQQELQRLQGHMGAIKAEQDQQLRGILDKIAKMEADLKASESVKTELKQAHAEAQSLVAARQELINKVQQLTQDLQRSHGDVQQIPALMSELEALRQEYQHCRATYDYERKLRIDHYESLQVMEKNYVSMVREVEKLRAELTNATNLDRSGGIALGGQFGTNAAPYKENDASGYHPVGQNAYEDSYGAPQGRGPSGGAASYGGGAVGSTSARAAYDTSIGHTYDASRGPGYDVSRGTGYDSVRGGSYDGPRGTGYEAPRAAAMAQAAPVSGNPATPYGSTQKPSSYGAPITPAAYGSMQQATYGSGQTPTSYGSTQQAAYGSGQTPTHAGGSYEAPRGGNTARR
ncbi:protein FLX-like 2 [Canna indica]|uniref:Protein FLX-like 2 n=1 Tax=Canna indica TaxID=4628 RepID=A0AAQ3K068_9LILI|nr:protein FLX-like 2 [Canna indica]